MKYSSSGHSGFSLVEISIALGILAFVMLAIVGLMGVGLDSSKSARVETAMVNASRFAISSLQTNAPATLGSSAFWFNYDGVPVTSSNAAHFQCVVLTNKPASSAPRLIGLRLEFRHPLAAPEARRTTNTVYASILATP